MILALDVATQTGFAVGLPGCDVPLFGVRNFGGAGGTGEVVAKFRAWVIARCVEHRPQLIVIEQPFMPRIARQGLRRLFSMVDTAQAVAWELRIDCQETPPLDVAKFFVGTRSFPGRTGEQRRAAKKAATIAACYRLGWPVQDNDDAADALALWALTEARVAPALATKRGFGPLSPTAIVTECRTLEPIGEDQPRSLFTPSLRGIGRRD